MFVAAVISALVPGLLAGLPAFKARSRWRPRCGAGQLKRRFDFTSNQPWNPCPERKRAVTVIQHSATNIVERCPTSGRVATMIGALQLPGAVLELQVSGDHLDLTLESRLEDEECELAADNAVTCSRAFAHIDLDGEHAEGLVTLLRQAIEIRALGMTGSEAPTKRGTIPPN